MSCYSSESEWPYYQHQIQEFHDTNSHTYAHKSTSKRKSRASKRSPVTVLNADASNFRALVQQLTGRPSAPARLRAHKGPLTINFRRAKVLDESYVSSIPIGYGSSQCHPTQFHQRKERKLNGFDDHDRNVAVSSTSSVQSKACFPVTDVGMDCWEDFDDDLVDECIRELIGDGI
ncbi:uncharacterized protein LOC130827687 [Amaranthus tricolor]|uniref:uncharacterized protein LOC130827687 n=1 Tax=Amaranthus tricolor TaxID=29722 RepID=UPI0025874F48|nr:uncharacterized protein LOC130827687 [Amaranthus tricolor]